MTPGQNPPRAEPKPTPPPPPPTRLTGEKLEHSATPGGFKGVQEGPTKG